MKPANSNSLYSEIKKILEDARQSAYRSVNFAMVLAYWEIGKRIVEHEQLGKERAGYGEALLKELSKKLSADFGRGFILHFLIGQKAPHWVAFLMKSFRIKKAPQRGAKTHYQPSQKKVTHCVAN